MGHRDVGDNARSIERPPPTNLNPHREKGLYRIAVCKPTGFERNRHGEVNFRFNPTMCCAICIRVIIQISASVAPPECHLVIIFHEMGITVIHPG